MSCGYCVLCDLIFGFKLPLLSRYLPSFPYQDSVVLHIYAGLLCLFLAHPQRVEEGSGQNEHATSQYNRRCPLSFIHRSCGTAPSAGATLLKQPYVRDCRSHLRRAADLDPEHPVPLEILQKVRIELSDVNHRLITQRISLAL